MGIRSATNGRFSRAADEMRVTASGQCTKSLRDSPLCGTQEPIGRSPAQSAKLPAKAGRSLHGHLHLQVGLTIILPSHVTERWHGFDHVRGWNNSPPDQNYPNQWAINRLHHSSLRLPQPMREKTALTDPVSHWRGKGSSKYFLLFTQDPCQHPKVVPILLSQLDDLPVRSLVRAVVRSP